MARDTRNLDPASRDILPDLIIHPTAVSLRQVQRRALARESFFDGRRHTTLSAFFDACATAALGDVTDTPLRPIGDLDRELAIVEAVARFRSGPHQHNEILRNLSSAALEETLAQLIDTVAPLADRAPDFLALLAADRRRPKNPALAALYADYAAVCHSLGVADETALNAAILRLLRGDRARWPVCIRHAQTIAFRAIRWVAPFQETVIAALAGQLGRDHVLVSHILADYEQDWWGGGLVANAGQLLFGDAAALAEECAFQSGDTRASIEQFVSLREGYAMQDPALAAQAQSRVGFSCSVGVYGEIEDLARRIAWELYDRPDPVRPEEICLVCRDLGEASDAIMDVFTRFGLPYYFRRGVPVLAVPVVKTLLNLARFSAGHERNRLCSLLESPWLRWEQAGLPFDAPQLADDLLRSGVEPVVADPQRMVRHLAAYYRETRRFDSAEAAEQAAAQAATLYRSALGKPEIVTVDDALADLLHRCATLGMDALISAAASRLDSDQPPEDEVLERRAAILNAKAYETATEMLRTLRRHDLVNRNRETVTWHDIEDLLNRALKNLTVAPAPPDESGVWILNPYDVAGLTFKVVLVAGLNAGAFPKPPSPSPLFPDAELLDFRAQLQQRAPLPAAALPASKARNSQENLLFLTTLAATRERLVLSYSSHDETGQEQPPSVFFSTLWRLVGWPAWTSLPATPPDPYDAWRLAQTPAHLQAHWQRQTETRPGPQGREPVVAAFKRQPFPGESYLGTVPWPLCRADDERWQRVAHRPEEAIPTLLAHRNNPSPTATHVAHGISVEWQREAFFAHQARVETGTAPVTVDTAGAPGHAYAGVLDTELWAALRRGSASPIPDFSPTQLERLVACPYQYYLQYVLCVEPIEPNELEPRPQDFGTAVHEILRAGFMMLQGRRPPIDLPALKTLGRRYARLSHPAWAVRDSRGCWHLQETPEQPSPEALPLVAFVPGAETDYLEFFSALTGILLAWATRVNAIWMLGAPEQLEVQRRRVVRAVRNLVRTALDPEALPECDGLDGVRRFPALLEYTFDSRRPNADAPALELSDPAARAHPLRVHGKIDRVDLVFDAARTLRAVIVVDYKGAGKAQLGAPELAAEMAVAADCQLAVYGLAIQSQLLNGGSGIPVLMHYLSYTLPPDDLRRQCRTKWLGLEGQPLADEELRSLLGNHPSLTAAFSASVFAALRRYERGDFAVAPRACAFCPLQACCRHAASRLPQSDGATENTP